METIPPTLLRASSSWATLARLFSAATTFPVPDAGRPGATPPQPPVLAETLLAWAAARWPGLTIEWVDLHQPMARYSNGGLLFGGAVVQIDRRLRGPELTCALAEELGHHATLLDAGRERRWMGRMLLARRNEAAALSDGLRGCSSRSAASARATPWRTSRSGGGSRRSSRGGCWRWGKVGSVAGRRRRSHLVEARDTRAAP